MLKVGVSGCFSPRPKRVLALTSDFWTSMTSAEKMSTKKLWLAKPDGRDWHVATFGEAPEWP